MTDKIMMDGEPLEVGDPVYCLLRGEAVVCRFDESDTSEIIIKAPNGNEYCYTKDFRYAPYYVSRTLYWQKPEITPPPKPKKK